MGDFARNCINSDELRFLGVNRSRESVVDQFLGANCAGCRYPRRFSLVLNFLGCTPLSSTRTFIFFRVLHHLHSEHPNHVRHNGLLFASPLHHCRASPVNNTTCHDTNGIDRRYRAKFTTFDKTVSLISRRVKHTSADKQRS